MIGMRSALFAGGSAICMVKCTSLGMLACKSGTEQDETAVVLSDIAETVAVVAGRTRMGAGLISGDFSAIWVPACGFCESIELTIDCQPGTLPFEVGGWAKRAPATNTRTSRILIR